jgi:hypothetical protein
MPIRRSPAIQSNLSKAGNWLHLLIYAHRQMRRFMSRRAVHQRILAACRASMS